MAIDTTNLPRALAFGAASVSMYAAMFFFSEELIEMAHQTRQGRKALFIVPIAIAFAFSYFHGAFTGYFWDVLGLKPAPKKK